MPAYNNPDSNESLYEDAGSEGGQKTETKEAEGPTAILPKSILAGKTFEPGDEVVLKIVSMQGDEVVVEYSSGEAGYDKEKPAAAPEAPPMGGGGDMASMME